MVAYERSLGATDWTGAVDSLTSWVAYLSTDLVGGVTFTGVGGLVLLSLIIWRSSRRNKE